MEFSHVTWRKSSYSNANGGNCVEVAAVWRKSSYSSSNGGACVEVASVGDAVVAVRDSKNPDGPKLAFPAEQWRAFTREIKAGAFDRG
jgi:Domain of unknown function (DUF397)